MKRYSFWRTALTDYVQSVAGEPFEPGKHDCALFVAGAIKAMTGEDLAAAYRGKYSTITRGKRKLRKDGFDDHVAMAASLFEEVAVSHAMVGDVASIEVDGGAALGIVQGDRVYFVSPQGGIGTASLLEAQRAFRVPFNDGDHQ